MQFQHTATRRWLQMLEYNHNHWITQVSTHSHPKVAASKSYWCLWATCCFNTQPPEGGCTDYSGQKIEPKKFQHTATRRWLPTSRQCETESGMFQHTATRRWLQYSKETYRLNGGVSTHSHPKVAAMHLFFPKVRHIVSTHSHPKVAALNKIDLRRAYEVSTHSHPKVAAYILDRHSLFQISFNTQPPEGGCGEWYIYHSFIWLFQHTATRRWLREFLALQGK